MGSTVCQAVEAAGDLELVARLDVGDPLDAAHLGGADVAVDFTVPATAEANVHALIDAGVDVVVGTTGWTEASYGRVREHLGRPEAAGRCVLIAPNFALSAVLAMGFAARAARYFESAEVIELHHPNKVDAPSGTAMATARGIAAARAAAGTVFFHAHIAGRAHIVGGQRFVTLFRRQILPFQRGNLLFIQRVAGKCLLENGGVGCYPAHALPQHLRQRAALHQRARKVVEPDLLA